MGSVIPLKKEIVNSYSDLKNLVENKLDQVNQRIKFKLASEINLIHKMTNYHLKSGGKRIRLLLVLGSAKLCGYTKGDRDINLAACVELIHNATLLHDDVIDESDLRRGTRTSNAIWGNQSSILVGDYLFSRCFEMMVEDGMMESGVRRFGCEQEMFLVDRAWQPAPVASKILELLDPDNFTTELALFNLEMNIEPMLLKGKCFTELEERLEELLGLVRSVAHEIDTEVVLSGILPTLSRTGTRRWWPATARFSRRATCSAVATSRTSSQIL